MASLCYCVSLKEKCKMMAMPKHNTSKIKISHLMGVSHTAVNRIIKKLQETDTLKRK